MTDQSELERVRPIARQAVAGGYLAPIKLGDVYWFRIALVQEAENKYGLKSDFDLYRGIGEAFELICARCGVYTKEAKDSLSALSPDAVRSGRVSYLGPNVQSLAEGKCPGCGTDTVAARFNQSLLDQRFGKAPFIIGEAHIFVENGAPTSWGVDILRKLQPISCEQNKDLKFQVYPVPPPWPENREDMIVHTVARLRARGVRWEVADGNNEFQIGEAYGKRFFALYLRKAANGADVRAVEKAPSRAMAKPEKAAPQENKGWWGRLLDRIAPPTR